MPSDSVTGWSGISKRYAYRNHSKSMEAQAGIETNALSDLFRGKSILSRCCFADDRFEDAVFFAKKLQAGTIDHGYGRIQAAKSVSNLTHVVVAVAISLHSPSS